MLELLVEHGENNEFVFNFLTPLAHNTWFHHLKCRGCIVFRSFSAWQLLLWGPPASIFGIMKSC